MIKKFKHDFVDFSFSLRDFRFNLLSTTLIRILNITETNISKAPHVLKKLAPISKIKYCNKKDQNKFVVETIANLDALS